MQSCLEKRGIEQRAIEIVRSDYNENDQYNANHSDAISNGDALGKGTQHGGHSHYLPDCNKPTSMINYSNFDKGIYGYIPSYIELELFAENLDKINEFLNSNNLPIISLEPIPVTVPF